MKTQFKTVLKCFGTFIGLAILLIAMACFYLKTGHARHLILDTINRRIPGSLYYETCRVSLLKGEIQMTGAVLEGPARTPASPPSPIAAFPELKARLALPDLLHGIIRIQSLTLTAPRLSLAVDKAGQLNLLTALGQKPSSPPPDDTTDKSADFPQNIIIDDFQIHQGDIRFTSLKDQVDTRASRIDLQVSGNWGAKSGRMTLTISRIRIKGERYHMPSARLACNAVIINGTLEPLQCLLNTPDLKLALSGTIHNLSDQPRMDLKLDVDAGAPEIQDIFSLKGRWSGRFTGRLTARGNMKAPTSMLTLQYSGGMLADYAIERLGGTLTFENRQLTLQALEAVGENIQLTADGRLNPVSSEIAARLSLNTEDVHPFLQSFGLIDVSGRLNADAVVTGTIRQPVVDCRITAHDIACGRYGIDTAALQAGLNADGRLEIASLTLSKGQSALALSADADLFETDALTLRKAPTGRLTIRESRLLLEDVYPPFKGALRLAGAFTGNLTHPQGHLSLEGNQLDFGIQKIARFQLQAASDGKTMTFAPFTAYLNDREWLKAQGHIALDGGYAIKAESSPIALATIEALNATGRIRGNIRLNVAGTGTLSAPELGGTLRLSDLRVNDNPVANYDINVRLANRKLAFSARQDFELDGVYDVQRRDFNASLLFRDAELAPYFAAAGYADLNGILNGSIETRGNTAAPDAIAVNADIAGLVIHKTTLRHAPKSENGKSPESRGKPAQTVTELLRSGPFTARFNRQRLEIPALELSILQQGRLNINGQAQINGPLHILAQGHLPLEALEGLEEMVANPQGDISLTAKIEGDMTAPRIEGRLRFDDIRMVLESTQQHFQNINGEVRITPQRIIIEGIDGQVDEGRFQLAGNLDLENFQPSQMDITAKASAVPIRIPETLNASVNSDLRFRGKPEKARLEGHVMILDGIYTKDIDVGLLQILKPKAKRETQPASKDIQAPFLKNTVLDIRINYHTPFEVDNNVAMLDILPDLHVRGTLNNPIISGRAEVESGTIKYQRRTFTIEKGVIDFINPYKIEPQIDIVGQSEVRSWNIRLTLAGTPDQLEFKLTSDPQESDEDILSLLLLGKTTRELIKSEGGAGRSAEQMLAQFMADTYGDEIKRTIGIDILEVDTSGNGSDADGSMQVTIGKELSRRLIIKYAVESDKKELVQRAIAEYKLWEHFLMQSSQDSKGAFDASLLYRLEFR